MQRSARSSFLFWLEGKSMVMLLAGYRQLKLEHSNLDSPEFQGTRPLPQMDHWTLVGV